MFRFLFLFISSRPHPGPGPGPTPRPEARPGGSKKGFLGGPKRGFPGGFRDPKRATGGILPTGSLAKNRVFRGFFRGFWGIFGGFLDPRRASGKGVGPGGTIREGLTVLHTNYNKHCTLRKTTTYERCDGKVPRATPSRLYPCHHHP